MAEFKIRHYHFAKKFKSSEIINIDSELTSLKKLSTPKTNNNHIY